MSDVSSLLLYIANNVYLMSINFAQGMGEL